VTQPLRHGRRGDQRGSEVGDTLEAVSIPGGTPRDPPEASPRFDVHLDNFTGPFDLLLRLIAKHQLDITEVALSQVTDEFIAHIRAHSTGGFGGSPPGSGHSTGWDLDQTSQFIVVASTLLDLKAARLLPAGEVEDPEDLALLEARDLLFARLLQYRAFKQVAAYLAATLEVQGRRFPRDVGVEPRFAGLLPEVNISLGLDRFAALAARALAPKPADVVSLAHLHTPLVSVRDQAVVITDRLRRTRALTFRALTGDSPNLVTTVARFLALLELFREGAIAFEQLTPLGELTIRWTGSDDGELDISDEFDAPGRPVEVGS
jgi:segregation and condensation protein A